jgi:hypothetical protein
MPFISELLVKLAVLGGESATSRASPRGKFNGCAAMQYDLEAQRGSFRPVAVRIRGSAQIFRWYNRD